MARELTREDWDQRGSGPMTTKQRKMLNGVCGDLARCIYWHDINGRRVNLDKDDWRHFFSGIALGQRFLRGWDSGSGPSGFIVLGRSSLELTVTLASQAIDAAIHFGDNPESQGVEARPVQWSDAVLYGMGYSAAAIEELRR